MELSRKGNAVFRTVSDTYDNTQRLIRNIAGSFNRFNNKNRNQKLSILFNHKLKKYLWAGYFVFGLILVINVIIMTFYLVDSNYKYNFLENSYVDAVLPSQNVSGIMDLGIVRVENVKYSDLSIGDEVVIYGDFSIDVYWVETIVGLDDETMSLELTYDQVSTNTYHIDEVVGQYANNAKFFGTVYYSSMYSRGYLFMLTSHLLLLYGYWYAFLSNKQQSVVDEEIVNTQNKFNILSGLVQEITAVETVPDLRGVNILIPPVAISNTDYVTDTTKEVEAVKVLTFPTIVRSKSYIIEYITAETGLNNYKGKQFLKYFSQIIAEELSKGNDVNISNFGKFTTVTMPAKDAINPQTNESITVPEHKQARLRFYNKVKSKL